MGKEEEEEVPKSVQGWDRALVVICCKFLMPSM